MTLYPLLEVLFVGDTDMSALVSGSRNSHRICVQIFVHVYVNANVNEKCLSSSQDSTDCELSSRSATSGRYSRANRFKNLEKGAKDKPNRFTAQRFS